MSQTEEIEYSLLLNIEDATTEARKLERALYRALALANRMGLPENISYAVQKVNTLISAARSATIALHALQAARMAAGDPFAWIFAGLAVGSAVMTVSDIESQFRSGG